MGSEGVKLLKAESKIDELEKQLDKSNTKIGEFKKKVDYLTDVNIELAKTVNEAKKVKLPKLLSRDRVKRGDHFFRVMIPDVHGNKQDPKAVACMFEDLKLLGIGKGDTVIQIGDLIDCGGFLTEKFTLGYVSEIGDTSFAQDIAAGRRFIDRMVEVTPGAEYHFLEGNHEARVEAWCVTKSLRHQEDAQLLLDMFGVDNQLNLHDRGIKYYKRGEFHNVPEYRGLVKFGKCYYTHGSKYPTNAAKAYADTYNVNIVYGHTHRADTWTKRSIDYGSIISSNPGTMSEKQPAWKHDDPTNWTHGYNLQIVAESGDFLNINVPIINGVSYLYPLLENKK